MKKSYEVPDAEILVPCATDIILTSLTSDAVETDEHLFE